MPWKAKTWWKRVAPVIVLAVLATACDHAASAGPQQRRPVPETPSAGVTVPPATTSPAPKVSSAPKPGTATGSPVRVPRPRLGKITLDPAAFSGQLIEVSIATQRLTMWENGKQIRNFLISTGRAGFATPIGRFAVRAKYKKAWSRKWKVWMPYTLNFYQNYNLHELPHARGSRKRIGGDELGRPASHGCIRIGLDDAPRLYAWANVGTPVWIH